MNRAERPAPIDRTYLPQPVEFIYRRLSPLKQTENPPHLPDKYRRTEPRRLGPLGGFLMLSTVIAAAGWAMADGGNSKPPESKGRWIDAGKFLEALSRREDKYRDRMRGIDEPTEDASLRDLMEEGPTGTR